MEKPGENSFFSIKILYFLYCIASISGLLLIILLLYDSTGVK